MSDRLHDHLTLGFRRGCLACAQYEADLKRARRFLETSSGQAERSTEDTVPKKA